MKTRLLLRACLTGLLLLLVTLPAAAYIGLCCAKCGGNMPMNILGGGIPETHEFRFKISPMYMRMDGLRDGTSNVSTGDILGMPVCQRATWLGVTEKYPGGCRDAFME